jgi:ligand-binding sensor domain-containing protein
MSGTLEFPVGDFNTNVLTLSSDSQNIYVGTQSGLFVINKQNSQILPFGPDQYAVYYVYPTDEAIYVGGEFSLYKYARNRAEWTTVSNFGIKDIVGIEGNIYALGTNNQIMQFESPTGDSSVPDTSWILLPYFNIYDIETDNRVLYCATYSGMYYYDPAASTYNVIYNLPRISYDYVFVVDENILAVSKNSMYLLPLEYRD